jgi:predicted ATPase
MVLASMKLTDPKQWSVLKIMLDEFGVESGLFKGLRVKALGRKESDPFQVEVTIAGPPFNMVDVGYGVSQVLPIVVDCLRSDVPQTVLMQQPEVHLHPRAQAALGSFLAYLVKHRKHRFVIETHSDYLVDRIRLEVREGKGLGPDDVAILYCEHHGAEVKVHPLRLDHQGNILDAPSGYRSFFLEEEKRLLGG